MSNAESSGRGIILSHSGPVATIRLARPEKLNALTPAMRADLVAVLDDIERSDAARAIILTGEGRGFCSGGDIDHLAELKARGDRQSFVRLLDEGSELVRRFRASAKVTIAAINGPAVGGGFILALACDLRVMAASAVLGMPFAKIGMGPDWGGTWMLTRLVGTAPALDMLLTGRLFTAQEAAAVGLVDRLCADDRLVPTARTLAEQIAAFPPDVIAGYKQIVYAAETGDRDLALAMERRRQLACFDHPEFLSRLARFSGST